MRGQIVLQLKKHLPIIIFIGTVLFTHLTFFIYTPIPQFDMDTFGYFHMAQLMSQGIPVGDLPIDMPMGYSLLVLIIKSLGGNLLSIVFFQSLFYLLAGSYTVYSFIKYRNSWGWAAGIAFTLFTFHPFVLRYNTTLYTEGIYLSSLIFLTGTTINYFRNQNIKSYGWLCFGVLLGITIRSNGIVLLIIPVVIIAWERWINKKLIRRYLIVVALVVVSPQLLLNGVFKHQLAFSESNRIVKVFKKITDDPLPKSRAKIDNTKWARSEMYKAYFFNIVKPQPSYYYSLSPFQYQRNVIEQKHLKPDQTMFNTTKVVDDYAPQLKQYIFGDYYYGLFNSADYKDYFNYEKKKRKWMYLIHVGYEILNKSKLIFVLFILFWIGMLYYAFHLVKDRFQSKEIMIGLIASIHILPLIILPFAHGRFQARYIFVSEFIVFLVAMIFFTEVIIPLIKKPKKIAQQ